MNFKTTKAPRIVRMHLTDDEARRVGTFGATQGALADELELEASRMARRARLPVAVWYGRELLRVEPPAERRPSRSGMH